jgi:hypothetical protein
MPGRSFGKGKRGDRIVTIEQKVIVVAAVDAERAILSATEADERAAI